jgi:hypothetical protein
MARVRKNWGNDEGFFVFKNIFARVISSIPGI